MLLSIQALVEFSFMYYGINDLPGSGFVQTSKNKHISGSAAVRATVNNDNALDTFGPKAFVLCSLTFLVKIAFPIDSDPGPTSDL